MLSRHVIRLLSAAIVVAVVAAGVMAVRAAKDAEDHTTIRKKADKNYTDSNFKTAYEGYRKLALDPKDDPKQVSRDLTQGIACLQQLGRVEEVDDFREGVIAQHSDNWRLLQAAARSFNSTERYGYIVANKFYRGHKRGGGRYVSTWQRDRVRAFQLMNQALPLAEKDADKQDAASFFLHFSDLVMNGVGYHQPWRLQYLTDLNTLPDYEEGYYRWRGSDQGRGAPVDEQNKPLYYSVPKGWDKSANDGERWRWLMARAIEYNSDHTNRVDMTLATFFRGQYGVQTMHSWGWRAPASDAKDEKTGTFALHTLKDSETIAKLATGLQRFTLPDEFNWIKIYERVAERDKRGGYGEQARDALSQEFEDRRQYVKAAAAWKKAIEEHGKGYEQSRQKRLNQIVDNWGRFEGAQMQPDDSKATVEYRFRNGKKVDFEAHAIKVDQLLSDTKDYLKKHKNNAQIDYHQTNIADIGYRLVGENHAKYIGDSVVKWSEDLKPRDGHVDARITITAPMTKPGAYLVTAKMKDGNTSRVIIWIADTAIVKKRLDNKIFYFVADASTGKPVERANLEFFGWKTQYIAQNQWKVETTSFDNKTDGDGQLTLGDSDQSHQYQWLVIARKEKDARAGGDRFAYLGFSGVWYGQHYDPQYHATKVLNITDRPVYRPEHKVKFKSWIRHAKYDQGDVSDFAKKNFTVIIRNPKGDKVYEKNHETDDFAGLDGEYALPKDATLGVYFFELIGNGQHLGGHRSFGSFRVEEYKKPEFEVKIEAPKEPVALGEQVKAKIDAR
jgi:hypothetical protein